MFISYNYYTYDIGGNIYYMTKLIKPNTWSSFK